MGLFKKKGIDSETMKNGAKLITLARPQSVISEQFRNIRDRKSTRLNSSHP